MISIAEWWQRSAKVTFLIVFLTIVVLACGAHGTVIANYSRTNFLITDPTLKQVHYWQLSGRPCGALISYEDDKKDGTYSWPYVLAADEDLALDHFLGDVDGDGGSEIVFVASKGADRTARALEENGVEVTAGFPRAVTSAVLTATEVVAAGAIENTSAVSDRLVKQDDSAGAYVPSLNIAYGGLYHDNAYTAAPEVSILPDYLCTNTTNVMVSWNIADDVAARLFEMRLYSRQINAFQWDLLLECPIVTSSVAEVPCGYPEGIYDLDAQYIDLYGNLGHSANKLYVDLTPPFSITATMNNDGYFSPNGDGHRDQATGIVSAMDNFNLPMKGIVCVSTNGESVTVSATGSRGKPITVHWNGKNTAGQLQPDGPYPYQLYIADRAGNSVLALTGNLTLDTVPPQILSLQKTTEPVVPDNGSGGGTTFSISCSEPVSATIEIKSPLGFMARVLTTTSLGASQNISWDGTDFDGIMQNGVHTFLIIAEDKAGNQAVYGYADIYVQVSSPLVKDTGVYPDSFSPARGQTQEIFYTTEEPVTVSVEIYNSLGSKVAVLDTGTIQQPGDHTFIWNGCDASGNVLADGGYTYRIVAWDALGAGKAVAGPLWIDTTAPSLLITSFTPAAYAVTAASGLNVNFSTSETISADVLIYTAGGTLVRQLAVANRYSAGTGTIYWDAKDYAGTLVVPGVYAAVIRAKDMAENAGSVTRNFTVYPSGYVAPPVTGISVTPEVRILAVEPNPFSPDGDNAHDETFVSFTVSGNGLATAAVTVYISSSTSANLVTLLDNSVMATGDQVISWNGRNNSGVLQPDGVYTFHVKAQSGNKTSNIAWANVSLQSVHKSLVLSQTPYPNPFSVSRDAETTFVYEWNGTVSGPAPDTGIGVFGRMGSPLGHITARILDVSGNVIRSFAEQEARSAGSVRVSWNGTNAAGIRQPDGIYTSFIMAQDLFGVTVNTVTAAIVFDTTPPVAQVEVMGAVGGFVTSNAVTLKVTATDNLGFVSYYQLSHDGKNWVAPVPFMSAYIPWVLIAGNGNKEIHARFKDNAGNWTGDIITYVSLNGEPPVFDQMLVNGTTNNCVNDPQVVLSFLAHDENGVDKIFLSSDEMQNWSTYPHGTDIPVNLQGGDGTKNVYIRLTDKLGNMSPVTACPVILDRTQPYGAISTVKQYVNTTNVELVLGGHDALSGIYGVRIGVTQDLSIVPVVPAVSTAHVFYVVPEGDGEKIVFAQFRDRAGNYSSVVTAGVILDTVAPQISAYDLQVNEQYLPGTTVPVSFNCNANETANVNVYVMRGAEKVFGGRFPALAGCWNGINSANYYVRPATYSVQISVVDLAGNEGARVSRDIRLTGTMLVASRNYNLYYPAIEVDSNKIRVEYEDDADYSVNLCSFWVWNNNSGYSSLYSNLFKRHGLFSWGGVGCMSSRSSLYEDGYQIDYRPDCTGSNPLLLRTGHTYQTWGAVTGEGYTRVWSLLGTKMTGKTEIMLPSIITQYSTSINRSIPLYQDVSRGMTIPFAGAVNMDHKVTANASGYLLYTRNGTTIQLGDQCLFAAEPAMIVQSDLQGNENAFIAFQGRDRNNANASYNIYICSVPGWYEDLPAPSTGSIITLPGGGTMVGFALQNMNVRFTTPVDHDHVEAVVPVNVSLMDTDGVSTSAGNIYVQVDNVATYDITAYYTAIDPDHGTVKFTLGKDTGPQLSGGTHTIAVYSRDMLGNWNNGIVTVEREMYFRLRDVIFCPNPMDDNGGYFTYQLTQAADLVKIHVYNTNGELVKKIDDCGTAAGYNEVFWDGEDDTGRNVANDVYLYVITARNANGTKVIQRGKMAVLK